MRKKISSYALISYGALAAPVAFTGFPLYVLAPDFYAVRYDVSLASLGFALLFLRLFDAVQDPLIGALSDRARAYIKPAMVGAGAVVCISIFALFNLLYVSPLFWFVLCVAFAMTAYSLLSINLSALGALWTKDAHMQTRIALSRETFALIGVVIAVSLPSALGGLVPQPQIYIGFAGILSLLMLGALWLFLGWFTQNAPHLFARDAPKAPPLRMNGHKPVSLFRLLGVHRLCAASKKLVFIYTLSMLASSIPAVLVIFFVRDRLAAEAYLGLFLLLYFLAGIGFMPVWSWLSRIFGKYKSWLFSMILASATFVWAFTLDAGQLWQYAFICAFSGIALGADLVFPPAILADNLHSSGAEDSASSQYAVLTFAAKAALAGASAVALPALSFIGFVPDSANSAAILQAVSIAYALIPSAIKLCAAFMLWWLLIHRQSN